MVNPTVTSISMTFCPWPYTKATLDHICSHITEAQETLGRQMLLENPSTYVSFAESTMTETDFIEELARRSGCALLLDVNNVFVSCTNHRMDAQAYIDAFPTQHVREIHLAGHEVRKDDAGDPLLIDAHGSPIVDPVWALYEYTLAQTGPLPTLIERDANVPPLSELLDEAARANALLGRRTHMLAAE